jgi:hypothetical protein
MNKVHGFTSIPWSITEHFRLFRPEKPKSFHEPLFHGQMLRLFWVHVTIIAVRRVRETHHPLVNRGAFHAPHKKSELLSAGPNNMPWPSVPR